MENFSVWWPSVAARVGDFWSGLAQWAFLSQRGLFFSVCKRLGHESIHFGSSNLWKTSQRAWPKPQCRYSVTMPGIVRMFVGIA